MKQRGEKSRPVYIDDPVKVIKLARNHGWSDEKIITKLISGRVYKDRVAIAKKYAEAMGLTLYDFMIIAGLKKAPS